jgi:cell division protein FtsI (penicillin-binding protein 3)
VLSFTDVIVKSSNVGAIKVGLKLGADRFGSYVRRFGFGRPTSPDFPGESPGIVWDPAKLNDSALASMLMGYQVAVTPVQMAAAMSAIANGGELIQPRVVGAVIRDGVRIPVPHKVVRRTVSARTAAELTGMLEAVVERGTAQRAQIDGYVVAGKTGTAQKIVNGRYSTADHIASFVGFVPSRKPVFTVIVVLDGPRGSYGGLVAAPVFQRIAVAALRHYGVPPTLNAPPPVLVARREQQAEVPAAVSAAPPRQAVLDPALIGDGHYGPPREPAFPDLRGLSAREAIRTLSQMGLTARVHGAGLVVDQRPEPGAVLEGRTRCELWLERSTDATHSRLSDAAQGRAARSIGGTQP